MYARREHLWPVVDDSLTRFTAEVFGCLPRTDQRRWARAYLSGLLSVEGRKSPQRMARAVPSATSASGGLQQFINSSPWEWSPARRVLADTVERLMPVRTWTVGVLNIPKRGTRSVGVHRRFVADYGRTVNSQLGLGMFLSSGDSTVPVDWDLFLDGSWAEDAERRRQARIPAEVGARPPWTSVLKLTDTMLARRPGPPAVLAVDLRTVANDVSRLAGELALRGVDFVIEVNPSQRVAVAVPARPSIGAVRVEEQTTVSEVWRHNHLWLAAAGADVEGRAQRVTASVRSIQLPGPELAPRSRPRRYRLVAQRSSDGRQQQRYWITSIMNRPVEAVLDAAGQVARTEDVLRQLAFDLGALDFEGRSYPGWHHHMTMVSAASVYRTLIAGDDRWQAGLPAAGRRPA
ncbi:hypothetical protein GCM10009760_45280 [Kitasatospora kazusensis]|uniref:Transposase IS701-like DDE domain-containing protein n=1 Tax=Kitasatospora kazusensis TaxID=407974 RepID=A0ABP5LNC4_9ACTN